ncbi:MAG: SDR family oxidoreductase [Acidimicrobiia bacterium]
MSDGRSDGELVLVTGATGFIAAEIVHRLLDAGYRVRGTVRDLDKTKADGHLTGFPGADERLELVEADLLTPHAFDTAVKGCASVIHTASPYVIDVDDPQRDLVDPAVMGTRSILEACHGAEGIRRLILTSSVAAITDRADGHVNTEDDWNTSSSLTWNPYHYSKTLAERAAWDFMEESRPDFDLVVINPFYVIGPSLVPGLNTSHTFFASFTNGRLPAILALEWPFVDVRDVAQAHIRALEMPAASGRHIVAAETWSMREVIDHLRGNGWGDRYRLPSLSLDRGMGVPLSRLLVSFQPDGTRSYMRSHLGGHMRFDNSKARDELGIEFRDVGQTILETMEDLDRWGHLGKRR